MLFGHQNDTNDKQAQDSVMNGVNPLAVDPDTGASLPVAPEGAASDSTPAAPVLDQPATDAAADSGPAVSDSSTTPSDIVTPAPTTTSDTPVPAPEPVAPSSTTASEASSDLLQPSENDDLLNLKQQALEQLSPLVDHLDQTPEEKFHTTMMMIRSSDNQALIKDAYAAAQGIADDKVRAQALLDIVNEINYFTQAK